MVCAVCWRLQDREIFADRLREIGEKIAQGYPATTADEAVAAASKIGYPVILRAAFALGGLGSGFAHDEASCRELAVKALSASSQVRGVPRMHTPRHIGAGLAYFRGVLA